MNEAANRGKPYIVMEGQVDENVPPYDKEALYEKTAGKRVIIYAGNIHGKYGIEYFVKGFLEARLPDTELRVYGVGDYCDELKALCETHPEIKYMGLKATARSSPRSKRRRCSSTRAPQTRSTQSIPSPQKIWNIWRRALRC